MPVTRVRARAAGSVPHLDLLSRAVYAFRGHTKRNPFQISSKPHAKAKYISVTRLTGRCSRALSSLSSTMGAASRAFEGPAPQHVLDIWRSAEVGPILSFNATGARAFMPLFPSRHTCTAGRLFRCGQHAVRPLLLCITIPQHRAPCMDPTLTRSMPAGARTNP